MMKSGHAHEGGNPFLALVEGQKHSGGKRPGGRQMPQVKRGMPLFPAVRLAEASCHAQGIVGFDSRKLVSQ